MENHKRKRKKREEDTHEELKRSREGGEKEENDNNRTEVGEGGREVNRNEEEKEERMGEEENGEEEEDSRYVKGAERIWTCLQATSLLGFKVSVLAFSFPLLPLLLLSTSSYPSPSSPSSIIVPYSCSHCHLPLARDRIPWLHNLPVRIALDRLLEEATDRLDRMFHPDLRPLRQQASLLSFLDLASRFVCGWSNPSAAPARGSERRTSDAADHAHGRMSTGVQEQEHRREGRVQEHRREGGRWRWSFQHGRSCMISRIGKEGKDDNELQEQGGEVARGGRGEVARGGRGEVARGGRGEVARGGRGEVARGGRGGGAWRTRDRFLHNDNWGRMFIHHFVTTKFSGVILKSTEALSAARCKVSFSSEKSFAASLSTLKASAHLQQGVTRVSSAFALLVPAAAPQCSSPIPFCASADFLHPCLLASAPPPPQLLPLTSPSCPFLAPSAGRTLRLAAPPPSPPASCDTSEPQPDERPALLQQFVAGGFADPVET
eukprot:768669-Hanusia_phi.AAC.7